MNAISKDRNIALIPFGIFALLLALSYFALKINIMERPAPRTQEQSAKARPTSPMEGVMAPAFNLPDINGNMVSLADHKGKIILLNLWATWCLPCREEMPSMQKLYDAVSSKYFEMIAISVDKDKPEVEAFVKELGLTFTILLDPQQNKNIPTKTLKDYKTTGLPETFLIDETGKIFFHVIGGADWADPDAIEGIKALAARAAASAASQANVAN